MSNDREQLEMAAKAAGIQLADPVDSHIPSGGVWVVGRGGRDTVWNPRKDDADALRLAMKLCAEGKMKIQIVGDGITCFFNHEGIYVPGSWGYETCTPDEAFRQCVTSAAAEIGRNISC